MNIDGYIYKLPIELKLLVAAFTTVLCIGFFSGILFVDETTSLSLNGIEEQYLGNEYDIDAEVMKFKKTKKQILTLIHNHLLSMSIIFFLLGGILSITKLNLKVKLFLIIEPFVSIVLTFGGLYLLWLGLTWVKYIVMFSGLLMIFCFITSVFIILLQLTKHKLE